VREVKIEKRVTGSQAKGKGVGNVSGNGSAIVAFPQWPVVNTAQSGFEYLSKDREINRQSQRLNLCAGPTRAAEFSKLDFTRVAVFKPPAEET
jgi:hypothetical protein